MRYMPPSMIPHAKLQPSALRSIVRTWMRSAVTTPSVKVKVSAIIKPNRISEILSIGSRIRSDDLAENGASGSTAVWIGSFFISSRTPVRLAPIDLTAETSESGGSVEASDPVSKCYPEGMRRDRRAAIDPDLRDRQ